VTNRLLGLAILLAVASGCKDSLYCERDSDCSSTQQCDVTGAIGGIGHTCVADPSMLPDANGRCEGPSDCSGATPVCDTDEGMCVQCLDNSTCSTAEAPVCITEENECGGCTSTTDCVGRADGRTTCDTDTGHCEACITNAECAGPTAPICGDDNTCHPCTADAQCPSGVCNLLDGDPSKGACVDESLVAYVNGGADGGNALCTKAAKCNTIMKGVAVVNATKKWVLIDAGTYAETVNISGMMNTKIIVLKANGVVSVDSADTLPAINVGFDGTTAANVTVEGLRLVNGTGDGGTGDGVLCTGAGLVVPKFKALGVLIDNNTGTGIQASTCDIVVAGSTIRGNDGGGVSSTNSNLIIVSSFFLSNGGSDPENTVGGMKISGFGTLGAAGVRVDFNTFVNNDTRVASTPGIDCDVTAPLLLRNNILWHDTNNDVQFVGINCKCSFCDIGPAAADPSHVENSVNVAPAFVGAGETPVPFYRLGPASPLRNAGDPAVTSVTADFDGESRVQGGRADIGADESP
jgi:hypothetical protein